MYVNLYEWLYSYCFMFEYIFVNVIRLNHSEVRLKTTKLLIALEGKLESLSMCISDLKNVPLVVVAVENISIHQLSKTQN